MEYRLQYLCPLIEVFDMRASLAFYRDLLGFEIVESAPPAERTRDDNFGWVWLRRDAADIMLNSAYDPDGPRPEAPDPVRATAHNDTGLYFGCPDVDAVYGRLRAQGAPVSPPRVASYGMRQVYVKDPDGFNVCFQWPAKSTPA